MNELNIPTYLRLRDAVATQISKGLLAPHSKLPSERELKEKYDITRITVRQALMQLESEGLIYRLIRRGWYISPERLLYDPTETIGFMELVRAQDRTPKTVILSKDEMSASPWVSNKLGVKVNAPSYLVCRRRSIDGLDVLVERIHINAALCPDLLDHPLESLTDIFKEQYGIIISHTQINMHPAPLNEPQADELKVVAGTPGLFLSRSSYDQHGNIVEYDQEFWRHDSLEISLKTNSVINK